MRTSASSGLSHPVGTEPSPSGLQVGALRGEVWPRKGGGLAQFCRRLAADLPGPEPVGTSTRIGPDMGGEGPAGSRLPCFSLMPVWMSPGFQLPESWEWRRSYENDDM